MCHRETKQPENNIQYTQACSALGPAGVLRKDKTKDIKSRLKLINEGEERLLLPCLKLVLTVFTHARQC
jgi:hypothetical protein